MLLEGRLGHRPERHRHVADARHKVFDRIDSGDGFVEFTVGETGTFWVAGLNHGDETTYISDIDFAFRFNGAGYADVLESGTYQFGGDTTYVTGDVFRIAVENGRVSYLKNGKAFYTSRVSAPAVLRAEIGELTGNCAIYGSGSGYYSDNIDPKAFRGGGWRITLPSQAKPIAKCSFHVAFPER